MAANLMYDFPLTGAQRTALRGHGQTLKPSLHVGKAGLTPELLAELQRHLNHEELVKIRFHGPDRHERAELLSRIADEGRCVAVGSVGQTALVYRQNADPERRVVHFA